MKNLDFGHQLRFFRQQAIDKSTNKPLTQQKLGELLEDEIGVRYSGAAISDWERGQSEINVNDRDLLIAIIKILERYGGIKTLNDANTLLESGNYRAFNATETYLIFPNEKWKSVDPQNQNTKFVLENIIFDSPEEYKQVLDKANEGPPPAWPRIFVAFTNKITSRFNVLHVLRGLTWLWIWGLCYFFVMPSLQLSNINFQVMALYAAGTLIIPPLIAALVNTKDNNFWKEQKIENSLNLRLYVHQGAYVGFHVGYFLLFPIALLQNQFDIPTTPWIEFIKALIPLFISYTSAQLIPHNLLSAYKRLHLKDGIIVFTFVFLGVIWAWFFWTFNDYVGTSTFLIAITLVVGAMAIQYRKHGNTNIPTLWFVIFYGLIFVCQIAFAIFMMFLNANK